MNPPEPVVCEQLIWSSGPPIGVPPQPNPPAAGVIWPILLTVSCVSFEPSRFATVHDVDFAAVTTHVVPVFPPVCHLAATMVPHDLLAPPRALYGAAVTPNAADATSAVTSAAPAFNLAMSPAIV